MYRRDCSIVCIIWENWHKGKIKVGGPGISSTPRAQDEYKFDPELQSSQSIKECSLQVACSTGYRARPAWTQMLALHLPSTNYLKLWGLSLITCPMRMIMVPSSWGYLGDSKKNMWGIWCRYWYILSLQWMTCEGLRTYLETSHCSWEPQLFPVIEPKRNPPMSDYVETIGGSHG